MSDWQKDLDDFFKEQMSAAADAKRSHGERRAEARRLIDEQVMPAFAQLTPAFYDHVRRVDVDSSTKDADNLTAFFRVNRLTFDRRDPNRPGEEKEFVYTVKLTVAPRDVYLRTEVWPRSEVRRANGDQPSWGIDVPNADLNEYPRDWLIRDVVTEYTAYMRSERK